METHRHLVLVVDDDAETTQALATVLEVADITPRAVSSGGAAIDVVAQGLIPCVILMDLRMPGLDGWETWRQISLLPGMWETPIVLLSSEPPDYARAARVGVREVLQKPVTYDALVAAVRQHCAA